MADPNCPVLYTDYYVPLSEGGATMIVVGVVLVFMTTLWTGLRLYCRRLKKVEMQPDDWLHLVGLVLHYGQIAASFVSVAIGGAGHHSCNLSPSHLMTFSQLSISKQLIYGFCSFFIKLSICFMLMRVFANRKFKIAVICVMVFTGAWLVLTTVITLTTCKPVSKSWDNRIEGTCDRSGTGYMVVAVLNIVNELLLLILPIPMLWSLQMRRPYKIGIAAVFSSGLLTISMAALRVATLLTTDYTDLTFDLTSQLASMAEPAVGLLVSCSPLLKPVLDKILMLFGYKKASTYADSYQNGYKYGARSSIRNHPKSALDDDSRVPMPEDELELRYMGASHGTTDSGDIGVYAEGHHSEAASERDLEDASRIMVQRETIISRQDRKH